MPDNRALILQRVFTLLKATPNIKTVVRNRGLMQNEQRPAIALLDGDEIEGLRPPSNGRGAAALTIMRTIKIARPQIFVLLKTALPKNETGPNRTIGDDLHDYRNAICNAILQDAELKTLMGSNGSVVYQGAETDLRSGAAVAGQMRIDFSFTYIFDPRT